MSAEPTTRHAKRLRWPWIVIVSFAVPVLLIGCWTLSVYQHWRQQMDAAAVMKEAGAQLVYEYDAPFLLKMLRPNAGFDPSPRIGPAWLRNQLPTDELFEYFLVVRGVAFSNFINITCFQSLLETSYSGEVLVADKATVLSYLPAFDRLESLECEMLELTDADLKKLRPLRDRLHAISLSKCPITDEGVVELRHFRRLQIVDLSFTQITDNSLAELADLPQLQTLHVKGTRITEEGLKPFRARPGFVIEL